MDKSPRETRKGAEIGAISRRAGKYLSLPGNAACGQICPFPGHVSSAPGIRGNVKPLHARGRVHHASTEPGTKSNPPGINPGQSKPRRHRNTIPARGIISNPPKTGPTTTPGKAPPDFPDFGPFRPGLHRQNMVLPTQKTKNAGNGLSCPSNFQDGQNYHPHPDNATAAKLSFFDKSNFTIVSIAKSISYALVIVRLTKRAFFIPASCPRKTLYLSQN